MLDRLLSFAAPHHCSGCDETGSLLCDNCKYDIISEPYGRCVSCGKGIAGASGLCSGCHLPYGRAWCVADRRDHLQQLINNYKYANAKSAYRPLADLLHMRLPELPENCVIVPVPTVNSHIRQRGYDHMLLIARQLAKTRQLSLSTALQRTSSASQQGSSRMQRIANAKTAFACKQLDPDAIYLLVDDVITTGSTVKYAAKALAGAGATKIWVASISRQPSIRVL